MNTFKKVGGLVLTALSLIWYFLPSKEKIEKKYAAPVTVVLSPGSHDGIPAPRKQTILDVDVTAPKSNDAKLAMSAQVFFDDPKGTGWWQGFRVPERWTVEGDGPILYGQLSSDAGGLRVSVQPFTVPAGKTMTIRFIFEFQTFDTDSRVVNAMHMELDQVEQLWGPVNVSDDQPIKGLPIVGKTSFVGTNEQSRVDQPKPPPPPPPRPCYWFTCPDHRTEYCGYGGDAEAEVHCPRHMCDDGLLYYRGRPCPETQ